MDQEATITMQQLRSKAKEHLLHEEWREAISAYSNFISLYQQKPPDSSLCLALSNRAEALFKLRKYNEALKDCEQTLQIDSAHLKTLICRGKIHLALNRYSSALESFQKAVLLDPNSSASKTIVNGYITECKKLQHQSKTGSFDVSDWVVKGFNGRIPELGGFIGPIEIKYSCDSGGRGMFATRDIECGSLLLVTKAVATERCIIPKYGRELEESAQLVMWKNFVNKVTESAQKCPKTRHLLSLLSTGDNNTELPIPDLTLFKPDEDDDVLDSFHLNQNLDMERILNLLDVNSLVEDSVSSTVLGKNCSDYYGIGLWILPSFLNHSCCPNSRRLHIGDHALIVLSRDVKSGEEITLPYFDILTSLANRKEMARSWGFVCHCRRCKFEEQQETFLKKEIEVSGVEDFGFGVYKLEENMNKWGVKGKERGYLRASHWNDYSQAYYQSGKVGRLPSVEVVVESVVAAVGSDQRILKLFLEKEGRRSHMFERAMRLGRGVYGKIVKKQALRNLLHLPIS